MDETNPVVEQVSPAPSPAAEVIQAVQDMTPVINDLGAASPSGSISTDEQAKTARDYFVNYFATIAGTYAVSHLGIPQDMLPQLIALITGVAMFAYRFMRTR